VKDSGISCLVLGALLALSTSVTYLLCGPKDLFGIPDPAWARALFFPGIYVGTLTWEVIHSTPVGYVTGVLTMTLVGALLGGILDLLVGASGRSRGP